MMLYIYIYIYMLYCYQILAVLDLLHGQLLLPVLALDEEVLPVLLEHRPGVLLLLVHDVREVLVQDAVHVLDRDEVQLDLALLGADVRQRLHHVGQRVDVAVAHLAEQLLARGLDHLADVLELLEGVLCRIYCTIL